jgi:hypothetical protein
MSCTYKPHFQTLFIEDGTSVDAFHRTQNLVKVQLVPELGEGGVPTPLHCLWSWYVIVSEYHIGYGVSNLKLQKKLNIITIEKDFLYIVNSVTLNSKQ